MKGYITHEIAKDLFDHDIAASIIAYAHRVSCNVITKDRGPRIYPIKYFEIEELLYNMRNRVGSASGKALWKTNFDIVEAILEQLKDN